MLQKLEIPVTFLRFFSFGILEKKLQFGDKRVKGTSSKEQGPAALPIKWANGKL